MKVSEALKTLNGIKDKNRYITPFYKVKTMIKILEEYPNNELSYFFSNQETQEIEEGIKALI